MSKSIRSYPKEQQSLVIARRLEHETGGLGYWAALDAENTRMHKQHIKDAAKHEKEKPISTKK